ncbi:unnamed protein product [Callosobruchus maculatus]|uniref:Myb/SANT-like DNA-binding domain-containing protein n=1 Tax=Callosobruchus maculatus TaxID=64391 RepID=A0A653D2G2_CALMS|nr:unnamed protein product [Callosobruchus maculatus]
MKKLWERVASDIGQNYNIEISAAKCENRFKVLERNYKKVVDNNNRTGRARKIFEYQDEFDEMLGKRANINPQILLSSNETFISPIQKQTASTIVSDQPEPTVLSKVQDEPGPSSAQQLHIPEAGIRQAETPKSSKSNAVFKKLKKQTYRRRNDVFMEMREDMRQYYENKLKLETEKISLAKEKMKQNAKKLSLFEEYVKELRTFNRNHEAASNKQEKGDSSSATHHPL